MQYFKTSLAVWASIFILASGCGCSRGGPSQKPSQSVPDSKALRPVKQAMEKTEDELEKQKEAAQKRQEEKLELLDQNAEKLEEQMFVLREQCQWARLIEVTNQLVASRQEYFDYVNAEGLDRKRSRAHVRLARAYRKKGDSQEAESHLLAAVKSAVDDREKLMVLSPLFELYMQKKDYAKALETAQQATPLATEAEYRNEWRLALIKLDIAQKKYENAQTTLKAYLKELEADQTLDGLDAEMDCYGLLTDIAWEQKDKTSAAQFGVKRAEASLKRAHLKLEKVQSNAKGG